MTDQKPIPLDKLNPQQLTEVKRSLEEEIQVLNQSLNQFKVAISKYEESKQIIKTLENAQQDQELLVPISSSLYVPGSLQNDGKVIIDYGTGYYVERNLVQAHQFCNRKLEMIRDSQEKLTTLISQKANFLDKINFEIQKKYALYQQEMQKKQ
ncbi:prefoldin subunit 5, putative [Ichthyophthirius multifiliis]|uniref:Prefoldin subunit 5, putative n=1 Tax=Ichthyophthirius multifiliis TaxID=5932 RepID=G0R0R9_ICHMU|nr:prefoldin subunit 5, putative [Ichthyophthirius multifiliis]EGR28931.1 prefoldin subunit 5, putative [Ichthyophthirius multifiliis]|eukprot:XP_004030167.1 prefoldin subunit 5, putative [Ichthyophthirius multifiliis]